MLVSAGLEGSDQIAILGSKVHVTWALAAGGTLEDRPRYNKTRCFETFLFPALASPIQGDGEEPNKTLVEKLRSLGEQLDAHRKRQQAAHAGLTLTGMYNVLEKLKSGEPLTDKEKIIHEHGLVSVLKSLHDEIDLAVLDAYGWGDLAGLMQVVNGNGRELDCPSRELDCPSRELDCPSRELDCPSRELDGPHPHPLPVLLLGCERKMRAGRGSRLWQPKARWLARTAPSPRR